MSALPVTSTGDPVTFPAVGTEGAPKSQAVMFNIFQFRVSAFASWLQGQPGQPCQCGRGSSVSPGGATGLVDLPSRLQQPKLACTPGSPLHFTGRGADSTSHGQARTHPADLRRCHVN